MKILRQRIDSLSFSERSVPFFLLLVMTLALGLLLPELGFFQDDWIYIFFHQAEGAEGIVEFLYYDGHPLSGWSLILSFALLGSKPLYWHIFSLFWRWLTATAVWFILIRIWPHHKDRALVATLIFALHPAFVIQSQALIYSQVWISYFVLAISFYFTVVAIQNPGKFARYMFLAILFKLVHAVTDEYTWGTELMRPVLIWLALPQSDESRSSRLKRTVLMSLPFLAIVIPQFVWRGLIYESPVLYRSEPLLFNELLLSPVSTLIVLIQKTIPDIVLMLFSSWNRVVEARYFDFSRPINVYLAIVQLVTTLGALFYLHRSTLFSNTTDQDQSSWTKQALVLGIVGMILGIAPTVAAGYFMFEKIPPWNTRFIFGPLIGVALILSAFFYLILTSRRAQILVLAVAVGALANWHERNADDFRQSWQKQERLYQQLLWRAPSIKPNTAIITSEEILGHMGDYPTSFSINSIYEASGSKPLPYWFFALSENFEFSVERLREKNTLEVQKANASFKGDIQNIIFITYEPENKQCLWVLRPEDATYKDLPGEMKKAALMSNYKNISADERENRLFHEIVKEDRNTWCFYYQKADLARQLGDWDTVVSYWEDASGTTYRPENGFEYIVFIEAYAHLGNWETALALTNQARKTTQGMHLILCPTWQRLEQETPASDTKAAQISEAYNVLKCSP